MKNVIIYIFLISCFLGVSCSYDSTGTKDGIDIMSPDGSVQMKLMILENNRLGYEIQLNGKSVIEKSPLGITVDNIDLGMGVQIGDADLYEIDETYPWRGTHSQAVNRCNGAKITVIHSDSGVEYVFDVRIFDDGIAFCYVVPGDGDRVVSGEETSFVIPDGSTVWYHDFYMHYEGEHQKRSISEVEAGEWAAPPLTVKLPGKAGYVSITEAAIINYSGMALQAESGRSFGVRLGHEAEVSYPYILRYGEEDAERLKTPASINGTIKSPWRVVMIGTDLNTLVNCDIIHNVSPPPDKNLYPEGFDAEWLRPGRAVWGYLNSGGRTLEDMKRLSRLAGQMGFEYHVVEGHWANWPVSEQRELIEYSAKQGIKIILWKHSRDLRDPEARYEFFKHCHDIGAAGAKIDFFDHEAKEIIDLYQTCLKEAVEFKLVLDFHGANKPAGEARTFPNEIVREGLRGLEWRGPWAVHNTTLPFTRMLAGHADYTPMHFGDRRAETSEAHQIASAIVLNGPLLIFAEHPENMLKHPAVEIIKQIPPVWDETIVLPCSEIGEISAFARRSGEKWFISIMNGLNAKISRIDLTFLGEGDYNATFVRDQTGDSSTIYLLRSRKTFGPKPGVEIDNATVNNQESLFVELTSGGGFVAVLSK
ncbi:glycoside hydrolase family 97 N-terminal domain-containing protein [Candidatus Latescibacterota bacterium]